MPEEVRTYGWIVFPAIAAGVALAKVKTELMIKFVLEGESYKFKGGKETVGSELEKRERLGVVSDTRIILSASPEKGSYFKQKHEEGLKNDLKFLIVKLNELVPKYRIPALE